MHESVLKKPSTPREQRDTTATTSPARHELHAWRPAGVVSPAGSAATIHRLAAAAPAGAQRLLLEMQRQHGNRHVQGVLDQVVVQRKRTADGPSREPVDAPGRAADPTGIPAPVRAKMEESLGSDFSDVRVHPESAQAEGLGALAFTHGNNIHFAPGRYQPESRSGQELLGHELAHVLQQREGRVSSPVQARGLPVVDDSALEDEADELGARAARGERLTRPRTAAAPCALAGARRSASVVAPGPVLRKAADKSTLEELKVASKGNAIGNVDEEECLRLIATLDANEKAALREDKDTMSRLASAFNAREMLEAVNTLGFALAWKVHWIDQAASLDDVDWFPIVTKASKEEIADLAKFSRGVDKLRPVLLDNTARWKAAVAENPALSGLFTPLGDVRIASKGNAIGNVDEEESLRLISKLDADQKAELRKDKDTMSRLASAFNAREMLEAVNTLGFALAWKVYWIDRAGSLNDVDWFPIVTKANKEEIADLAKFSRGMDLLRPILLDDPARWKAAVTKNPDLRGLFGGPQMSALERLRQAAKGNWIGNVNEEHCLSLITALTDDEKKAAREDKDLRIQLAAALNEREIVEAVNGLNFSLTSKIDMIKLAGELDDVSAAAWKGMIATASKDELNHVADHDAPTVTRTRLLLEAFVEGAMDIAAARGRVFYTPLEAPGLKMDLWNRIFKGEVSTAAAAVDVTKITDRDKIKANEEKEADDEKKVFGDAYKKEIAAANGDASKIKDINKKYLERMTQIDARKRAEMALELKFNITLDQKDPAVAWSLDEIKRVQSVVETLPESMVRDNQKFDVLTRGKLAKDPSGADLPNVGADASPTTNTITFYDPGFPDVYRMTGVVSPLASNRPEGLHGFEEALTHEIGHTVHNQDLSRLTRLEAAAGWQRLTEAQCIAALTGAGMTAAQAATTIGTLDGRRHVSGAGGHGIDDRPIVHNGVYYQADRYDGFDAGTPATNVAAWKRYLLRNKGSLPGDIASDTRDTRPDRTKASYAATNPKDHFAELFMQMVQTPEYAYQKMVVDPAAYYQETQVKYAQSHLKADQARTAAAAAQVKMASSQAALAKVLSAAVVDAKAQAAAQATYNADKAAHAAAVAAVTAAEIPEKADKAKMDEAQRARDSRKAQWEDMRKTLGIEQKKVDAAFAQLTSETTARLAGAPDKINSAKSIIAKFVLQSKAVATPWQLDHLVKRAAAELAAIKR
ncbi:eCIS core domain-containing protein [Sorangium sp. So ce542]|uniref:eCIS core domain-containing protein n=1 Tax=Sorangium sp. So ce542 TaxID=3133316 RepID=UPI003F5F6287